MLQLKGPPACPSRPPRRTPKRLLARTVWVPSPVTKRTLSVSIALGNDTVRIFHRRKWSWGQKAWKQWVKRPHNEGCREVIPQRQTHLCSRWTSQSNQTKKLTCLSWIICIHIDKRWVWAWTRTKALFWELCFSLTLDCTNLAQLQDAISKS